jgi:hypothetical protein
VQFDRRHNVDGEPELLTERARSIETAIGAGISLGL